MTVTSNQEYLEKKEKKKKKSLLVKLLIFIGSFILSLVVGIVIFFLVINFKYNVNIIKTTKQIKKLNDDVNATEIAPYQFSNADLGDVKTKTDSTLNNLISIDSSNYKVNLDEISGTLDSSISLTDKECGAIIDNILDNQDSININTGSKDINLKDYDFQLIQMKFSNVTSTSTDFNVVIHINLDKLNDKLKKFPYKYLRKYVPDELYISSTVSVSKNDGAFSYAVSSKEITINNLSAKETKQLYNSFNSFLKIGELDTFNKMIGETFVNALIGNSSTNGFAYSLKGMGAKDYSFSTVSGNNYFNIVII